MFKTPSFLFVLLSIISCDSRTKQKTYTIHEAIHLAIEKNANSFISNPLINSVSIGIFKDGKSYTGHFGELDKGKGNKPTDSTIYEIASVSKSFTGTLVAQAVLDKKLSLEDDIRKDLMGDFSNLEHLNNPIRIKHLLTHTSGLPRFLPTKINSLFDNRDENLPFRIYNINKEYSKKEFLTDLKKLSIKNIPGTVYQYASADTELLAHILENIYKITFDELLQKYICNISEMENTRVHLSSEQKNKLANGYGDINNLVPHFANSLWGAGGGIKSTTPDLLNYIKLQLDDTHLAAKESHMSLYEDGGIQIGYLWNIDSKDDYGTFYYIHGGAFGTQNYLIIIPEHKLGVSIITNQSGLQTSRKLWDTLLNLLSDINNL